MHIIDLTWIGIGAVIFDILVLVAGYRYAKIKAERRETKKRKKSWITMEYGNEFHLVPLNDSHEHIAHPNCGCSPKVTPQPQTDGTYIWKYKHNAADGRI